MISDVEWVLLSTRFGTSVRNPSEGDITRAVREMVEEDKLGLPNSMLDEHPDCYIRYGMIDGSMHVITLRGKSKLIREHWFDQDFNKLRNSSETTIKSVNEAVQAFVVVSADA